MTLTENDKLFLQQLQTASKKNQTEKEQPVALVTNRALISSDLLSLFDIDADNQFGGWFFNVYVEFEPMFKEKRGEDWQK